jgi:hypothetical protein
MLWSFFDMNEIPRGLLVSLLIAALHVLGCQQESGTATKTAPLRIADSRDSLYRVRLTASKAAEYKLQTAPVREEHVSGQLRKVIPASAVVRDPSGNTWAVTNPEELVFVRRPIQISHIKGNLAVLSEGPPLGAAVVTAGADKLLSNEFRESGEVSIEKRTIGGREQGNKSRGMATMQEDGTIRVVYRTQSATGLTADIVVQYQPTDEEYQQILEQVGGLSAGETKFIPPPPEK